MANAHSLEESIAALSSFFVGDATLEETLGRVNGLACGAVPAADMVGTTMLVDGRPKTAVFTDEVVCDIDAAQYDTGVGPCLDAFRHQKTFRLDDTHKDDRWPSFAEAAAARGVRSTLSLPLVASREGVGALNLYSKTPNAFSPEEEGLARAFADQAGIALANVQAYWDAHQLSQQLSQAMASRATIEQAKGIIMAHKHCNPDEAFQVLVRASQRENRKLREIAELIVASNEKDRSGAGKAGAAAE